MTIVKDTVEVFFAISLFFNAILFIPQAIKIHKRKNAEGVSLLTFSGFNLIQFFTILHALLVKDHILLIGFLLSFITCGYVTFLIIKYK
jgi:MtN3 and saliva related transmembrane protein